MGHGVSTCATCDGFFFRGRPIAVVGGGDTAMEEALYLTRFASSVTVDPSARHAARVEGDGRPRAGAPEDPLALEQRRRARRSTKARARSPASCCATSSPATTSELAVDGVFVAIGHTPNTSLFAGQLETDVNGYLITHDGPKTSIPGVFACGDVQDHVYRQADHRRRLRLHGRDRRAALSRSTTSRTTHQPDGAAQAIQPPPMTSSPS